MANAQAVGSSWCESYQGHVKRVAGVVWGGSPSANQGWRHLDSPFNIPTHPLTELVAANKENATKVKLDMFWHIWGQEKGAFYRSFSGSQKAEMILAIRSRSSLWDQYFDIYHQGGSRPRNPIPKGWTKEKLYILSQKSGNSQKLGVTLTASLFPFATKCVEEIFLSTCKIHPFFLFLVNIRKI